MLRILYYFKLPIIVLKMRMNVCEKTVVFCNTIMTTLQLFRCCLPHILCKLLFKMYEFSDNDKARPKHVETN
jgi:hypothetical protein